MCKVSVIIWEQCGCQYCGPATACRLYVCSGTWSQAMFIRGLCPGCWMSHIFIPEMQMTAQAQMGPPMQTQYCAPPVQASTPVMAPQQSDAYPVYPPMQMRYLPLPTNSFAQEVAPKQVYENKSQLPQIPQQQLSCRIIHPFADHGDPCIHPDCQPIVNDPVDAQANGLDPQADSFEPQINHIRKLSESDSSDSVDTYDSGFVSA